MPGEFRGILVAFVHVANTRFDGLVWGIFVNKESTAKLAIYKLASCWQISSAKWNDCDTVYSLVVEDVKNCNKKFANMQVGVPIAERIARKRGNPLQVSIWILSNSYKMLSLETTGFTLLWVDLSIIPLCFNSFSSVVILFPRLIMWLTSLPAGISSSYNFAWSLRIFWIALI